MHPITELIELFAGYDSKGEPRFEMALVECQEDGTFLVLALPVPVPGLAVGDMIELSKEAQGRFQVISENGDV